ncbi:ATP-grasp domain-containing protein [Paenibacillus sp. sgz5001063]|uniref:ATP-grasp domain-containing protein n=1 Tax=Paenibacillus sp. sgz5001063 TaxID=3242474 RepID=UPI0036D3B020
MRFEVYGASSIEDHGKFVYKNYIGNVPNISEDQFIEAFNKLIFKYNIKFIIPTHDSVALFLMENQEKINATVVSSELETTKICRYKSLTYKKFKDNSFVPIIYDLNNVHEFPVFLKPDSGQGGKGTLLAHNYEELLHHTSLNSDLLICEYLPGEEITVDCFTDRNACLKLISPRTRERIFGGISVHSKLIEISDDISEIANIINKRLKFRGYWFIQLKKDSKGKYKLLEICTRMAGTFSLSANRDINLPLLSLLDFMDLDIEILPNNYNIEMDRSFINRYHIAINYDRIYVDLDDTLILRNQFCNEYLLMFLFQCLNKNKEVVLITRHSKNVEETLLKFKINPQMFSQIIHLDMSESKSQFMNTDKPSIFIDNSFAERREVKEKLHIPTFDISNIESLVDWRG